MIYESYWYNTDIKEIRAILFIMKKAQMPLTLTAGKYTTLSVKTFTTVIFQTLCVSMS